jgi:putative serine protease PepD
VPIERVIDTQWPPPPEPPAESSRADAAIELLLPAVAVTPAVAGPPRSRLRRIFTRRALMVGASVALVAWLAGVSGAFLGTYLADRRADPPRRPSTLGLVVAEPRDQDLPALDVAAVSASVGASVVAIQVVVDDDDGAELGEAIGTGIIVTSDGEIITNAHVIEGEDTVNVRLVGETEPRRGAVVAVDEAHDLALIRINTDGLTPATFVAPGDVRLGDEVVAIGYALNLDGDPSVTRGIVSALDRTLSSATQVLGGLIQTDAAISSGNSGGPLVNARGQVVGVNTLVAANSGAAQANGLGFAIAAGTVLDRVEVMRSSVGSTAAPSGFLGVILTQRSDGGSGALVTEVTEESPAAAAGVQIDDVVVAVDERAVSGQGSLVAIIRDLAPGTRVTVSVVRDGKPVDIPVVLGARPAD